MLLGGRIALAGGEEEPERQGDCPKAEGRGLAGLSAGLVSVFSMTAESRVLEMRGCRSEHSVGVELARIESLCQGLLSAIQVAGADRRSHGIGVAGGGLRVGEDCRDQCLLGGGDGRPGTQGFAL